MRILLTFLTLITLANNSLASQVPRVIIVPYNTKLSSSSLVHELAQMPLNHLGMILEYHDVKKGLPNIKDRKDVVGILSWFQDDKVFKDPAKYLKWLNQAIDSEKKVVIMGDPAFFENVKKEATSLQLINKFMTRLGMSYNGDWISLTYKTKFIKKDDFVEFEKKYSGFLSPYYAMKNIDADVHLGVMKNDDFFSRFSLITTNKNGGYVADEYAYYKRHDKYGSVKKWYINPFKFFKKAFDLKDSPVPDTTTINGSRIFYSHIDGDGFNNVSRIEGYKKDGFISAKVILEEVIKKYKNMPITVGFVAAEIDKGWAANVHSIEVARDIMSQDNVEIASHTYSHPFDWSFFENYKTEEEAAFLSKYPGKTWGKKNLSKIFSLKNTQSYKKYNIPRAYAVEKFSLQKEIGGSVSTIEELAPKNKKVSILQWSGDTSPYEKVLEELGNNNLLNINGGDSRFDQEYMSYGWVSPLSKQVGSQRQIYASNSNENTYTDEWRDRFFGFMNLVHTFKNTDSPIRIKPLNIYYHMYSGERRASLNAIFHNINYVYSQEIFPLKTSDYINIVNSFYKANLFKIGPDKWQIKGSHKLSTFRIDNGLAKSVNFKESKGVIGQRHLNGSLYIYLDKNYKAPIIAIKDHDNSLKMPSSSKAYLVSSNWSVENFKNSKNSFSYISSGWGEAKFKWHVPSKAKCAIKVNSKYIKTVKPNAKNIAEFSLTIKPNSLLEVNCD